jgi:hypothetical protein
MMKSLYKSSAALTLGIALVATSVFAGGKTFKEEVAIEEPTQWWNANLSTGWDSLYMFRGINVLRNDKSYGSSLYWTDLNVTFNLTENDFLTVGAWQAFGIGNTDYKEFDAYVSYSHTFGNLTAILGYTFYYIINDNLSSHELNVGLNYEIDLGFASLTPGIYYFFNLGPDTDGTGFVETASSFLELRVDAEVPLYQEIVALAPWVSFGTNFRYNGDSDGNLFNGTNNLEFGLALPVQINSVISVSPYVAYSLGINDGGLFNTRRSTFWGGGSVTFSF